MTREEFSNTFDVLVNSYSTVPLFGDETYPTDLAFNEYEKSVYLTKAQRAIVTGLYNGTLTTKSFEETEETRRYLDALVVTDTPESIEGEGIGDNYFYKLKDEVLFVTYEQVKYESDDKCLERKVASVVPVTQDDYYSTKENPFRGPTNSRVLRLDAGNNVVELVSKHPIAEYKIRYIKRPSPIILEDLPDGLKIDNENKYRDCELNPALHGAILDMAVKLAVSSRQISKT